MAPLLHAGASLYMNPCRTQRLPLEAALRAELGQEGRACVEGYLAACPVRRATPLISLPGMARSLGVASLDVKDESRRLGLGSFKALGGVYAILRLVLEAAETRIGHGLAAKDLVRDDVRAGQPVRLTHVASTVMAMLECYEASPVALRVLRPLADAFLAIPDE